MCACVSVCVCLKHQSSRIEMPGHCYSSTRKWQLNTVQNGLLEPRLCTFGLCCFGPSADAAVLRTCINAYPCPRLICHSRCIFAFILICTTTLKQPPIYTRRFSHLIDFVYYRWVAARPPSFCKHASVPWNTSKHKHNTSCHIKMLNFQAGHSKVAS